MPSNTLLKSRQTPLRLIENRVAIAGDNSQLSIYDTYYPAARVALSSSHLLYCGMLAGRKIMHGATDTPCDFLPNESFVLAPDQQVLIDFPEARLDSPTTCMTIEIDRSQVARVCDMLNTRQPRDGGLPTWDYVPRALHMPHGAPTQALLERLIQLYDDDHPDRDALIDLALDELIVRMLRTQSRELLLEEVRTGDQPRHGLAAALQWLRDNLSRPLDCGELARSACMSKAQLYRQFKREIGYTPGEYQQKLRIDQARDRLTFSSAPITQICLDLGYRSPSHFSRCFKAATGLPPSSYRRRSGQPAIDRDWTPANQPPSVPFAE
ncbi:helix-turn-helix domain-containing protein [Salinisphaera sp. SPP-AMP-43]|uniref:AraC family transcriptional regulator n=1 Tax=Salinisphaera sp. SPP-AMP-43 TaxID=3121288 RepID=UPI003C6E061D